MPPGAGKRKAVSGGGAKKKVAIDADALADAQAEFQTLIGPLPGGQWGSNLEHLQKKIAEAKAKRGPRGRTGGKGDKGARGQRGPKGPKGDRGAKGRKGDRGAKGAQGDRGATSRGSRGARGGATQPRGFNMGPVYAPQPAFFMTFRVREGRLEWREHHELAAHGLLLFTC